MTEPGFDSKALDRYPLFSWLPFHSEDDFRNECLLVKNSSSTRSVYCNHISQETNWISVGKSPIHKVFALKLPQENKLPLTFFPVAL